MGLIKLVKRIIFSLAFIIMHSSVYANVDNLQISLNGFMEIEGVHAKSDIDLNIATVVLGLNARLNKDVDAALILLYENETVDEFNVDIARIKFNHINGGKFNVIIGQIYLPFGVFNTSLVNNTFVQQLAEINETTVLLSYRLNNFSISNYLFQNDLNSTGHDISYGINLGVSSNDFNLGLDYISNISSINNISSGLDLHLHYDIGLVSLIAEYFTTTNFELSTNREFKTKALQFEAGIVTEKWIVAVAYQKSSQAISFDLPEQRFSIGVRRQINRQLLLAIEYWHDNEYSVSNGGTDNHSNSAVIQLVVNF